MTTKAILEKLTESIEALRGVAELTTLNQRELANDLAEMCSAVVEHSNASAMLADAVLTATSRMGQLFDRFEELEARFGRYVTDTAKQASGIRTVDARVSALEARLEAECLLKTNDGQR